MLMFQQHNSRAFVLLLCTLQREARHLVYASGRPSTVPSMSGLPHRPHTSPLQNKATLACAKCGGAIPRTDGSLGTFPSTISFPINLIGSEIVDFTPLIGLFLGTLTLLSAERKHQHEDHGRVQEWASTCGHRQ